MYFSGCNFSNCEKTPRSLFPFGPPENESCMQHLLSNRKSNVLFYFLRVKGTIYVKDL